MADKAPPSQPPSSASKSTSSKPPAYVSSSGHTLSSLPLSARLNRFADNFYNFMGLYLVSLLALDPYTAAQNSRFNTRGPGRSATTAGPGARTGTAAGTGSGIWGGGRLGGGSGPTGGAGSGGGAGRRVGTVDDVRGPECGSCG